MSIQFNKAEEKCCKELIEEWYEKEGQNLSCLRVTFEFRSCHNFKRHSTVETARLIRARLKKYKRFQRERNSLKILRDRNNL